MTESYKKAFHLTLQLIEGNIRNLRYVKIFLPGIYGTFPNYGVEQNDETCQAMKNAIVHFIEKWASDGEVEIEYASGEGYEFWKNIKHSSFISDNHNQIRLREDIIIPQMIFEGV
jgi:hypothetical protein